jgi:broad specificity phosphatase PhoE
MPKLILIKHARPAVDPQVPSEEWRLGAEGCEGAKRLGERLAGAFAFDRLHSSVEPKARETAEIVGAVMGLSVVRSEGLHEHERRNVPHMASREFISMVALFFKQPGERVLGEESADEAYERFARAVDGVVAGATRDVGVVTHGTVISAFAERRAGVEPFGLWRRMGLPSYLVLDTEGWRVVEVVERV